MINKLDLGARARINDEITATLLCISKLEPPPNCNDMMPLYCDINYGIMVA